MKIDATADTVRAITQVFTLASILDDRVAHPDKARLIAWAEQVQRHSLREADLLDGLQAFYDTPSERAIQVGDLIHYARAVRRERLSRESEAAEAATQRAGDSKAAEAARTILGAAVFGPAPNTPRLAAAKAAVEAAHNRETAMVAMRELWAAKAEAQRSARRTQSHVTALVARQRTSAPAVSLPDDSVSS